MSINIKNFLEENKNNNITNKFTFKDFIDFYKENNLSWEDLTIVKYSKIYYIVQCHKISRAQILIEKLKESNYEQTFFETFTITKNNIINPLKENKEFIDFFWEELKIRKTPLFYIMSLNIIILLFFSKDWLLDLAKKISEIGISMLWTYLSITIAFFSIDWFKYNKNFFENWKLWYYFNVDENLSLMSFYSIIYLLCLIIIISLYWDLKVEINLLNFLAIILLWFWFFLIYLNFINLIDFYIKKTNYLKLWDFKNKYFDDNYYLKNKNIKKP